MRLPRQDRDAAEACARTLPSAIAGEAASKALQEWFAILQRENKIKKLEKTKEKYAHRKQT